MPEKDFKRFMQSQAKTPAELFDDMLQKKKLARLWAAQYELVESLQHFDWTRYLQATEQTYLLN